MQPEEKINILGAPAALQLWTSVGFFSDGHCNTCTQDRGSHTVCAVMTAEFLALSKYVGNYFSTPRPEFGFVGLKAGGSWCLCASRFYKRTTKASRGKLCRNADRGKWQWHSATNKKEPRSGG